MAQSFVYFCVKNFGKIGDRRINIKINEPVVNICAEFRAKDVQKSVNVAKYGQIQLKNALKLRAKILRFDMVTVL